MLIFTIQQMCNNSFLGNKIMKVSSLAILNKQVKFGNHNQQSKYQVFYSKKIKKIKKFAVQRDQNYIDGIEQVRFKCMEMNCIYTGIPRLLQMPGKQMTKQLNVAKLKSQEEGLNVADYT